MMLLSAMFNNVKGRQWIKKLCTQGEGGNSLIESVQNGTLWSTIFKESHKLFPTLMVL